MLTETAVTPLSSEQLPAKTNSPFMQDAAAGYSIAIVGDSVSTEEPKPTWHESRFIIITINAKQDKEEFVFFIKTSLHKIGIELHSRLYFRQNFIEH